MNTTLTLYDFLRAGHIKRWHNVNVAREQTVAEHSYMVTLIALHMFNRTVDVRTDKETALHVVLRALFHDSPEIVAGDMPTPAKRFMRELTGDSTIFEKVDDALMPTLPYLGTPMGDSKLGRFIKMADAIEGAHWIGENGVGKHAQIVAAAGWRRVEDLVEMYDGEEPDVDWYGAVNEVLMALGMRYVHKQSRITPP